MSFSNNPIEQLSTCAKLHNQMHRMLILISSFKLHNVWLTSQRCVTPNWPRPSSFPKEYEDFTSSMGRPKTGPIGPCLVAGGGEGGACFDCGTEASAVGPVGLAAFEAVAPFSSVCPSPLSAESRP